MTDACRARRGRYVSLLLVLLAAGAAVAQRPGDEVLNETGQLNRNSQTLNSGEYAQPYTFRVQAGEVYAVRMYSTEFRPYIFVELDDDLQLDHSGTGGSSQAVFVAPRSREVRCIATTVAPGESGGYRLTVTRGQFTGRLGEGDEKLDSGEFFDLVSVYLPGDSQLDVALGSNEFAPYLITMIGEEKNESDAQRGQATTQRVRSGQAGEHQFLLTTVQPGEQGVYQLTVTKPGGAAPVRQDDDPPAGGGGGLGSILGGGGGGRTVLNESGSLQQGDETLRSGEFRDEYYIDVQAGQNVTVTCTSSEFDTYLIGIVDGMEEQVENDDPSRGNTNARISFTPTQNGRARILVTSSRPEETGAYRVTATVRAGGGLAAGVSGARPAQPTGGAAPIRGELRQGDQTLESGEFYDVHEFPARRGERYRITLTSGAFDAYLIVIPPGGEKAENDDGEGIDTNSQLTIEIAEDGNCVVAATTYEPGESGAYELRIEPAGAGGGGGPAPGPGGRPELQPGQQLGVGNFFEGSLANGDNRLQSGEFFDVHEFQAEAGQTYAVDMVSDQFNAYLIVVPPEGEQLDNDDDGGSTNSRVELRARQAGSYRIMATSSRPGESGRYTISVRAAGGGAGGGRPAVAPPPAGGGTQVAAGGNVERLTGELKDGDNRLNSGEFSDSYNVQVGAGQTLDVQLSSQQFDPYLIVALPNGEQEDNDDMVEGQSTAGLRITAQQAGTYRVICTSYRPGETGAYQLAIQVGGTGGTRPGGNVPGGSLQPPVGGGGDGRTTYGVFVGIDKYPDAPLQFCAGDAQNMAAAFEQAGIVPSNRRHVVTDAQATRDNVLNALRQVGQAAGPNDMIMFFFSGHGGQSPEDQRSQEADLKEEFIMCVDRPIFDDELAQLIDGFRAGLTLVYLDSCFSGGFAKDIITKPGRMGIFSSDEDLTSNVAGKFQAGGYLSYFMLKGIAGRADQNADKVITAAELSYYLEDSFNQEASGLAAVTADEQRGYQRLRIDRGGVKLDTPLFFLP